jgi:hypothetical protein
VSRDSQLIPQVLTKHDCTRAVVCVKQSDLDVVSRLKFEDSWGVQGDRFLGRVSADVGGKYVGSLLTSRFLRCRYL